MYAQISLHIYVNKKKNTSLINHGIKNLQFHSCLGKGFQSWPPMVLIKKSQQKKKTENENEK
jgi:hypothetical protein